MSRRYIFTTANSERVPIKNHNPVDEALALSGLFDITNLRT